MFSDVARMPFDELVAQAPGRRVHDTGLPFNDPSGDRLRSWMGIDRDTFYDEQQLAILPLPHPSPRNNLWLRRNPWFEEEVIPELRQRVAAILGR